MSVSSVLPQLTDKSLATVLETEWDAFTLTKTDCGHCARYQLENQTLLERGQLEGVAHGKIVLDKPGATQFKRNNPWLSEVRALPFTLIYHNGQCVDELAASKGFYLLEGLEDAGAVEP